MVYHLCAAGIPVGAAFQLSRLSWARGSTQAAFLRDLRGRVQAGSGQLPTSLCVYLCNPQ